MIVNNQFLKKKNNYCLFCVFCGVGGLVIFFIFTFPSAKCPFVKYKFG